MIGKHTKGPWQIDPRATNNVVGQNGRSVCSTGGYADNFSDGAYTVENEANAHLIAAAPELLYYLMAAMDWIDAVPEETVATLPAMPGFPRDDVDMVIAKARGQQ